jgi:anaerobic magnesium-protoporphyrin IX monomethyl ester cyclase
VGEGEETMLELLQVIDSNKIDFENVAGIALLKDNKFCLTPPRPNIKNIDILPMPARHKVDLNLYLNAWRERHSENAVSVSTMRGCPYTCKWCSRAVYGQSYRRRSAQLVVEELKLISTTYKNDTIWFVDDVFTISHKWLQEFHDELLKQNVKIKYECITRADRMNSEVIKLLRDSGCYRVWIGAESGSQRIIDAMDRRVDVNQVREMIIQSRETGLQAGTFIMLGYPGEKEEDLLETLHHLKSSNPDLYTITIAYPIKGTPLYTETESHFTTQPAWDQGTDRQIDFSRNYSRKYYDYAIRWIANEMALHKNIIADGSKVKRTSYFLKAKAARGVMKLLK